MTKSTKPVRVVLADDHEIFRDGFRVMMKKQPSVTLIGEAGDGEELIAVCHQLHPDIVITDIKMPKLDGIQATRCLRQEMPEIGIIALSMFDEEGLIVDMLEAGAKGYLIKNAHKNEIIEAIHTVYKDQAYYCTSTSAKLAIMIAKSKFNPKIKKIRPEFTEKEISIIKLICQEMSNKEIANHLNLSVRTIEGYRDKIQEKIGAKNTAGVVVHAIKHNIYKV